MDLRAQVGRLPGDRSRLGRRRHAHEPQRQRPDRAIQGRRARRDCCHPLVRCRPRRGDLRSRRERAVAVLASAGGQRDVGARSLRPARAGVGAASRRASLGAPTSPRGARRAEWRRLCLPAVRRRRRAARGGTRAGARGCRRQAARVDVQARAAREPSGRSSSCGRRRRWSSPASPVARGGVWIRRTRRRGMGRRCAALGGKRRNRILGRRDRPAPWPPLGDRAARLAIRRGAEDATRTAVRHHVGRAAAMSPRSSSRSGRTKADCARRRTSVSARICPWPT